MANFNYDSLQGDNVRFLQGTQAQLNKYLATYSVSNGEDDIRGTAIEGAFYLTTDTHKFYIGRKVIQLPNPNPYNVAVNDVYPEEISAGLTIVENASDLTSAVTNGLVHDGDIYYVKSNNILCVYESGESAQTSGNVSTSAGWVQINAPTGITGYNYTTTANGNDVVVSTTINTAAGDQDDSFKLVAGNNVTLTPGTKQVTIAATDTTYNIGTAASEAGTTNSTEITTTNGALLGLKKDGGSTLESTKVVLVGANDVGVKSNASGVITVSGPNFTNKGVTAGNSAGNGFVFGLEYASGDDGSNVSVTHSSKNTLDPTITIGSTAQYAENTNASLTTSAVHFSNGNATLNVYTKDQADRAITTAIQNKLNAANAMTYKGTIASADAINTIKTGGTGHIGDTYKASSDFTYGAYSVKTGDLVILNGTEGGANATITSDSFTVDVIPSGDEPFIAPQFTGDSAGTYDAITPSNTTRTTLNLVDSKSSNSTIASAIIPNTKFIQVTSTISQTGETATVNINHRDIGRNDTALSSLTYNDSQSDTLGEHTYQLFVHSASSDIITDAGHVTNVQGKSIWFKHNRLNKLQAGYGTATLPENSTLLSKALASVTAADSYSGDLSANLYFESSSLDIAPNASSNPTGLSVDIKWGSF